MNETETTCGVCGQPIDTIYMAANVCHLACLEEIIDTLEQRKAKLEEKSLDTVL